MRYVTYEKKPFRVFLLVAYGLTYLMGLLMWYGYGQGIDLAVFPNAQMMYPAAGVILGALLYQKTSQKGGEAAGLTYVSEKPGKNIPKCFFAIFLLTTVLMIVFAVASVFSPGSMIKSAGMEVSVWTLAVQLVLIGGSVLCWIGLLIDRKEKRAAYGVSWKNGKASIGCILLFILLYFLRTAVAYAMGGEPGAILEILQSPATWGYLAFLPVNFLLAFTAFFGEEYGWRYYLQPILQDRFGLKKGVLVLGLVWGIWHLPVDFFYYTDPGSGLIMLCSQLITCVTLGIFFGFTYMKTGNIWVAVILHYLNNNLVPVISGTYSADVLENQAVTWGMLPAALLLNGLFFGVFLFSKVFREDGQPGANQVGSQKIN